MNEEMRAELIGELKKTIIEYEIRVQLSEGKESQSEYLQVLTNARERLMQMQNLFDLYTITPNKVKDSPKEES